MAMDDLFQALNMFKQGVGELQQSRAIASANDAVQQIHASEASDQEKRAQLQQISNGLVAHLAQMGTPATTIQALQGAFGPKQYANANDMNKDALLTGNSQLAQEAQKQQEFESNPKFELAKLKASRSPIDDAFKQAKFQEMKDATTAKIYKGITDKANPMLNARGPLGVLERKMNLMDEVDPLTNMKKITPQQLAELPVVLNSALSSSGIGTEAGVQHLSSHTLKEKMARLQEMASSNPQYMNMPEFQEMYGDTIGRVREIADSLKSEGVKSVFKSNAKAALRDPDAYKASAAGILKNDPIVKIDPKEGVVFQSDMDQKLVGDTVQHVISNINKYPNAKEILQKISDDKPGAWAVYMRENKKARAKVSKLLGD